MVEGPEADRPMASVLATRSGVVVVGPGGAVVAADDAVGVVQGHRGPDEAAGR